MLGRKNQKKLERQWMLEVKGRSGALKSLRLRMAAGALAISAGVVVFLFTAWKGGEFLIEQHVYSNPAFAIDRLEIQTDGIIPVEQIRAWANVRNGDNLLALDLARIKRDLELVPLIQSATVERRLPRHLLIRVLEREPIARIIHFAPRPGDGLLEAASIYLDEEGVVIPPVLRVLNMAGFDSATRFLPVITGAAPNGMRPGRRAESPQLRAALRWIRAFQRSPMAERANVRSIDISSRTALLAVTEQGAEVSFPYYDFEPMLARWKRVHDFALHNQLALASLDLVVTNYVPAQWHSLTNGAAPAVRLNEPSPYRRRHV